MIAAGARTRDQSLQPMITRLPTKEWKCGLVRRLGAQYFLSKGDGEFLTRAIRKTSDDGATTSTAEET